MAFLAGIVNGIEDGGVGVGIAGEGGGGGTDESFLPLND